jgi:predicted NodU family carbamoyl transferase
VKVLGVNGWPDRGHHAAACLLDDGALIAFAEEERFTRTKNAPNTAPAQATAFCLEKAGIGLDDIDVVAFGWDLPRLHRDRKLPWTVSDADFLDTLVPRRMFPRRRDPELVFVPHHLAHGASAYHFAAADSAAVLVMDGQGETESTSLMHGRGGKLAILECLPPSWSFGYLYEAVCEYVGLRWNDAGKLMGLAGHGRRHELPVLTVDGTDVRFHDVPRDLRSSVTADEHGEILGFWRRRLPEILSAPGNYRTGAGSKPGCTRRDPFEFRDLAASVQWALERAVTALATRAVELTGEGSLVLAGGVALNASANGALLDHPMITDLFVQPVAHDSGVSLGAAAYVAAAGGDRIQPMAGTVALGPEFSPDQARQALDSAGIAYSAVDEPPRATADLIAGGKVVGWFQGRAEAGPRALGHRSILALPNDAGLRDHINRDVKQREMWRPFAPSMLRDAAARYLGRDASFPYMIVATDVPADMQPTIAGVVHADGTTRPQTVSPQVDPLYAALLAAVGEGTGHPVVLNTSFNGRDEPIVGSPADAIAAFRAMPLDALVIGPYIAARERQSWPGDRA